MKMNPRVGFEVEGLELASGAARGGVRPDEGRKASRVQAILAQNKSPGPESGLGTG